MKTSVTNNGTKLIIQTNKRLSSNTSNFSLQPIKSSYSNYVPIATLLVL